MRTFRHHKMTLLCIKPHEQTYSSTGGRSISPTPAFTCNKCSTHSLVQFTRTLARYTFGPQTDSTLFIGLHSRHARCRVLVARNNLLNISRAEFFFFSSQRPLCCVGVIKSQNASKHLQNDTRVPRDERVGTCLISRLYITRAYIRTTTKRQKKREGKRNRD